jgi:hypothetical protein
MATYYVGSGGNDSNNGTTYALRKLTLNGVEDLSLSAGDTVYVAPGTYRELLTCDTEGSSGAPITYIGDYSGEHTDGIGGVIRITGSDNDTTATRASCININSKDYRTFKHLHFDSCTNSNSALVTSVGDYGVIDGCYFGSTGRRGVYILTTNVKITNCYFNTLSYYSAVDIQGSADTSMLTTIDNCLFVGGRVAIGLYEAVNVTLKNCTFISPAYSILQEVAVDGTNYAYNNIFLYTSLPMGDTGDLTEDYNMVFGITRTKVTAGEHSVTYQSPFDSRWFFELTAGGKMVTPFDLASYSALVNLAGTSPTLTDMRGTSVQGDNREYGALEYDSTLDITAGSGGTSSVKIIPMAGRVGL